LPPGSICHGPRISSFIVAFATAAPDTWRELAQTSGGNGVAMLAIPRILAGVSGLLLLATAYLHSTGTSMVRSALAGAELSEFLTRALPTIWFVFSWHLVVVAVPLLVAAFLGTRWLLPVTVFCGAVTLGDFFWVFSVARWFPGTFLLVSVVLLLVVSAIVQLRGNRAPAT